MPVNYDTVLVAVDGSKEAKRALAKAITIALENDGNLIICHIVDTRTFAAVEHYDRMVYAEAEKYAEEMLRNYRQQALDAGVTDVAMVIDFGSPKVKIAKDVAKKHNVDLIVTGATGLNAVERFLIGSVSEHIARHARCDVLIVRNE
ncbi:universal stress protein [Evansella cellulosilytica]|uniref:Universal stress protein n=1 Tax=Evansella cellulosilytica (strain ATCC 21833 / DSM 2522 / FERM P-1141 / JCM 9156 / N-4) TaxID=649639 RepID=E6U138_EVAC2|nr:universal stress protein [Evansella cellulosilytica]ADU31484.1 UspA domain-containing protein [Evansella cellulosilytica DSM 2522]